MALFSGISVTHSQQKRVYSHSFYWKNIVRRILFYYVLYFKLRYTPSRKSESLCVPLQPAFKKAEADRITPLPALLPGYPYRSPQLLLGQRLWRWTLSSLEMRAFLIARGLKSLQEKKRKALRTTLTSTSLGVQCWLQSKLCGFLVEALAGCHVSVPQLLYLKNEGIRCSHHIDLGGNSGDHVRAHISFDTFDIFTD